MSHRVIHDWDEHRFHRVISDAFQMPTGAQSGYVITSDATGNFSWQPGGAGGGGGTQYWQDTGTALQPLSAGRGVSLGVPGGLSISTGNRLHIEGPNGVEVVGLMLKPIGSIFPVAGTLQWTGTALQFYDGTKWVTIGGAPAPTDLPPGSPPDTTIGYWLESASLNELWPFTAGRNVRLNDGASLYLNNARTARFVASPTVLSAYAPSGGVTWSSPSGEVAELTAAGVMALHAPGAVPSSFVERLQLDAGIVVGPALSTLVGTIQYAGGHFQGRNATAWVNLDGAGAQPGTPGNPLNATGVVPGNYGDSLRVPAYTVLVDGRLSVAANVAIDFATGIAGVGPNTGPTIIGIYPNLSLPDLVPPVPPGTYGDMTHLPTFTVNAKGLVTNAYQTALRIARDPMAKILDEFWAPYYLIPNATTNFHTVNFTPLATGRGHFIGAVQGFFLNTITNPTVDVLHHCFVSVYFYLDGVLIKTLRRQFQLFEPADANGVTGPIEVPFFLPWQNLAVGASHQLIIQCRNFNNASETTVSTYPISYYLEYSSVLLEEDAEAGVGTNSSYLLAGAVAGLSPSSGVIGSWVAVYAFTLPGGLGGSWALCKTAPGGTVDFNIQVNGVVVGTIHWVSGATTGGFTFPTPVTIHVGDLIEVVSASGVGDLTWTIRGLL